MILLPLTLTCILYYVLAKKLGKNPVLWAFVGIGTSLIVLLTGLPAVMLIKNPDLNVGIWSAFCIFSLIAPTVLAFVIARRNKIKLLSFSATKPI